MIDASKKSGADAVKFQTIIPERLVSVQQKERIKQLKKFQLSYDEFTKLSKVAKNEGVIFLSTPFDIDSALFLNEIVPAFKIASADITNIPLIKHVAEKKIPVFISTGMANKQEISEAIDVIQNKGNHDIIIMHCITSYPTKPEDANLEMIRTLQNEFPENIIGFSDHTLGTDIAVFSTFYGAKSIEKHFTFDNSLTTSPDHKLSLNPKEFAKMVRQLELSDLSRGLPNRISFDAEAEAVKFARRSLVSTRKIPKNIVKLFFRVMFYFDNHINKSDLTMQEFSLL